MTTFEHPLNERIRAFLRLQQLFSRLDYHLKGTDRCDLQAAMAVLLEIYDLTSRSNLKTEVLRELERHKLGLRDLSADAPKATEATDISGQANTEASEAIDPDKSSESNSEDVADTLDSDSEAEKKPLTLEQIDHLRNELHAQPVRSHLQLQNSEFLNSIRHRCGVSGNGSTFDLPLYHFWLDRGIEECATTIRQWLKPYKQLRESIDLILQNIRNNGEFNQLTAERGFYQSSLKSEKSLQLVRMRIPDRPDIYPEISAGIHRITSRFMHYQSGDEKPRQYLGDIAFDIAICDI